VYERAEAYRATKLRGFTCYDVPTTGELELAEALREFRGVRGDLTRRALGKALSARKDRIVNGIRLELVGNDRNGCGQWRVTRAQPRGAATAGCADFAGCSRTSCEEMGTEINEGKTKPAEPAKPAEAVEDARSDEDTKARAADDDRITCKQCMNLVGSRCSAAVKGEIQASRNYKPNPDLPHRCIAFRPLAGAPDQRCGWERWSSLVEESGTRP
jgi:hypothetical protein